MEEWRDVPGYEGLYQVSNLGRVRGMRRGLLNILSPSSYNGYYRVNLSKGGKYITIHIHRLVAMAFLPNPNNYPQVNHKDGDRKNNNLNNLEWCTASYNQLHAFRTLNRVRPRCRVISQMDGNGEIIKIYSSISEASRDLGVSVQAIRSALCGRTTHSGGYKWEYFNNLTL